MTVCSQHQICTNYCKVEHWDNNVNVPSLTQIKKLIYFQLQVTPYFVMHLLSHLPGLAGLFIAALFSGSLRY